jgi:predicted nucleic acid-binding protein
MIAIDANILLYAYAEAAPENLTAREFLATHSSSKQVAISEFTLTKLYLLLRNPAVLENHRPTLGRHNKRFHASNSGNFQRR